MELKTKKYLLLSIASLLLGGPLLYAGITGTVTVFTMFGALISVFGVTGTTACLVKGAFEIQSYKRFQKTRHNNVTKSFTQENVNIKQNTKETEQQNISKNTQKDNESKVKNIRLYSIKTKIQPKTTSPQKDNTIEL